MSGVTLLAAGGTIAMGGAGGAVPMHDAGALLASAGLAPEVVARTVDRLPGAQRTLAYSLSLAREVCEAAADGPVVVTHGTDTLEEIAYLCDLLYDGDEPIVFTGAMRPASLPGADGPANLVDAVRAAAGPELRGLGVVVCFAGSIRAARRVWKRDSVGPDAFGGLDIGLVREDRVVPIGSVERRPPLAPSSLDFRVDVVQAGLGDSGELVRDSRADGLVAVLLGAGHAPPPFLQALRAFDGPVVCTVRPERGAILHATYAFEGSERDVRAAGLVCAAALTPAAARIKLLAVLGAGADVATAFALDDV